MVLKKISALIVLILFFMLIVSCEKEPIAPSSDNMPETSTETVNTLDFRCITKVF